MALSNATGWIVLTTGNKSEMATGYSTLYGDSAGGFAVIKDVAKTLVYELCRYRNARAGTDLIPEAVLTKAPSAELRPDQRDDESLPPYSVLDPVMAGYVEADRSADDLVAEGFDPEVVARVVGLVDRAEYKRRQMPPGVRISGKAFGKDRRMPITNHYRSVAGRVEPQESSSPSVGEPGPLSDTTLPGEVTGVADATPVGTGDVRTPDPATALPLGTTAALVGEYRWIETALFATLGAWVRDMPVAAVQVHLDGQSMRHAWHADLWADRLPVLAGSTPTASPALGGRLRALRRARRGRPAHGRARVDLAAADEPAARPGALPRLAGLYRVVLPRLVTSYSRHLQATAPVADGPVRRALRLVLSDEIEDWTAGERLVQRLVTRPHDVAAVYEFQQHLESAVVAAGARAGLVALPDSVPAD